MTNNATKTPFVAILMGSDSDLSTLEETFEQLRQMCIPFEANILSAHRTPLETRAYVEDADRRGCAVFIAAAGLAAHLAGTVAALTTRPVIGIPMDSGPLQGFDALLSTVQMPPGTPVACVSIGKAGARNAAILAAQILSTQSPQLKVQLEEARAKKQAACEKANQALHQKLNICQSAT